jgi:hypothetical protein
MTIVYSTNAEEALLALYHFVESINTPGSGKRFLMRFTQKFERTISPLVHYQKCHFKPFASRGLSCIFINDWCIAFYKFEDTVIVQEVIHGKYLE